MFVFQTKFKRASEKQMLQNYFIEGTMIPGIVMACQERQMEMSA